MKSMDSYGTYRALAGASQKVHYFSLNALRDKLGSAVETLPFSLRILLENLLRHEDQRSVSAEDIQSLAQWDPSRPSEREVAFRPARVVLQDFTGVPAVVDLAAMRDAIARMGGDLSRINPLQPVDLVIDHSVQVDFFGNANALQRNIDVDFERNRERYQFLKWGQTAFQNFRVVPPSSGIVHQVNLEYLASLVYVNQSAQGGALAYPDTLVGTDSHTTMINGLGVLGWGVGGIEAEAAMLGQPVGFLVPAVVGFKLHGRLPEGATATDLVLTVTQMLRKHGVVGKFVEFYGEGMRYLSLPDRATIANMAPEYGATMGFFPVDDETLRYLRFTGRPEDHIAFVERYSKEQGLFATESTPALRFSETIELDLATVVPSIAGPRRPQDRVPLSQSKSAWRKSLCAFLGNKISDISERDLARWRGDGGQPEAASEAMGVLTKRVPVSLEGTKESCELSHGKVIIAAITSCTNTSNPSAMVAAGLLAKKAVDRGLSAQPWVKTSMAPGSQVVTDYLREAGLLAPLETLKFHVVGYGCMTCIGNSGPVDAAIADAVKQHDLVAAAVLSGNRNFDGRINPSAKANYLASPALVVAYALAGTMDFDFDRDPLGHDAQGQAVFLRDVWPSTEEVTEALRRHIHPEQFVSRYSKILDGPEAWREVPSTAGQVYQWDESSTYIRRPPFFESVEREVSSAPDDIRGARVLALLGDSVTTDHISPAGSITPDSPAGRYLISQGVDPLDFNSYGARRGNYEVMARGTFANIRLQNRLVPDTEGPYTRHLPSGEKMFIFDASERYRAEKVPLIVVAGKEYGTGSSRDWAAKGPLLLGIRAVIAESFERIHRSNLVGMGILPLEFLAGESYASLGLKGDESFDILGIRTGLSAGSRLKVRAGTKEFETLVRLDTPQEVDYFHHGGILPYVLRQMINDAHS